MNLYICVCIFIHTTDMPFIHSCVYFSPIEEFVTYYSFSLSDIMVDKTHSLKAFNFPQFKQLCVHLWLYIHTYMANTYTHTVLSLVLMQVDHEKNVGKVSCISVCAWNIL